MQVLISMMFHVLHSCSRLGKANMSLAAVDQGVVFVMPMSLTFGGR